MSQHGQRCSPTRARDTKDQLVVDTREEMADSDTQLQLGAWDELFDNTVTLGTILDLRMGSMWTPTGTYFLCLTCQSLIQCLDWVVEVVLGCAGSDKVLCMSIVSSRL